MPDGAAIFETSGAWEDFSTPSRDLRLLIAIDVVQDFPDRVAAAGALRDASTRALRTSKMNCEMCSHRSLRHGKSRIPEATARCGPLGLRMSPIGRTIATRARHANGMRPLPSA
jgi:hypothetical protein